MSLGFYSSFIASYETPTAMMTPSHCTLSLPPASYTPAIDWVELVAHRDYLVRFAKRKLQDPTQAEDVVHDVFEAVMAGRAKFAGRAALRSWLTAVLKNKIVDVIR